MTEKSWKDEIFNKVTSPDKPISYEMIYEALNLAEQYLCDKSIELEIQHIRKKLEEWIEAPFTLHNIATIQNFKEHFAEWLKEGEKK